MPTTEYYFITTRCIFTGVKTDIIYATKVNQKIKKSEKKKYFWYFDVKSDGYTLDNHRRKLDTPSDLAKYEEFRKLDKDQKKEMLNVGFEIIPFDKVRSNSNILVGSRYRKHKKIVSDYEIVTIGDVSKLISGYGFPMTLQGKEGSIPFYKVSDMNSMENEVEMLDSNNYVSIEVAQQQKWSLAPKGTVIFPKIGAAITTNKKRILSEPAIFDNNVMGILCGEKILPKFMLYILNSIDISKWATLANPPSISKDSVLSQQIPLPTIEEQNKIVSELESYRQIIKGAKQIIRNYVPKLPKFTYTKKQSLNNSKLFDVVSGGTPDSQNPKYWNGDVNWITLADLPANEYISFIKKSKRKITQDGLFHSSAKLLPVGTVVVSTRATIGRIGVTQIPLSTNQGFKNIIIKDTNIILPDFLALLLREKVGEMEAMASGATFKEISKSNFINLEINIPPIDIQKAIIDGIYAENKLIESSKELVKIFEKKISDKINDIWDA